MDGIRKQSDGPEPDSLKAKFSGELSVEVDLRRTQVVRLEVEGIVVGHTFKDAYDKDGDRQGTTKVAVLKVDQLLALEPIVRARRGHIPGQQTFEDVVGEPVVPAEGEITDAEEVPQLERGDLPPGVDENGEIVNEEAFQEGQPDAEDDEPDLEWR